MGVRWETCISLYEIPLTPVFLESVTLKGWSAHGKRE